MTKKMILFVTAMIFVLTACGGGALEFTDSTADVVTQDTPTEDPEIIAGPPGPQGPAGEQGPQGEQGPPGVQGLTGSNAAIPAGIWLNGVNYIDFFSSSDGLIMQAADTTAAGTSPGAFNGPGRGNKALVGVADYDDILVSDIASISVTARLDRGSSIFYFNMQVDCDGDGIFNEANDGIVVVDSDSLADFNLTQGVFTTIDLDPADNVFKMVGGPKASCGNLPSHLGGAVGSPLTDMPATATLWNGSTGDDGMPRDTELAAILFVMGDSQDREFRSVTIESISVNGDDYIFK